MVGGRKWLWLLPVSWPFRFLPPISDSRFLLIRLIRLTLSVCVKSNNECMHLSWWICLPSRFWLDQENTCPQAPPPQLGNDYPSSPWRFSGGTVTSGDGAGGRAWRAGGLRNRTLTEQAAGYNRLWYRAEAVAHKTRGPWTPLLRNSPYKFE